MAPPPKSEEEAFLDKLATFHEDRGTAFDRDPKVSGRPVKLLTLYNAVLRQGGYDALSAERMRWRQLSKEFGLGHHHEAAMTFQLKTVYYKYLTAFEIKDHWNEEPPPPEIVENLTAKGGDVRKRTLENYSAPGNRDSGILVDGAESGDEEQKTPKAGGNADPDDLDSGGRYPSRNLRQDPKRTQLFQPDLGPHRKMFSQSTNSPQASPAPTSAPTATQQLQHSSSSDPRNSHYTIEDYVPKAPVPMTLRPLVTPGNNPELFHQQQLASRSRGLPKPIFEPQQALRYVSSAVMRGPNIYIRCLYGLRSEIQEEQDFALHHLVKVSYERGDKYKFEGFPQLAEALLEKALEISLIVHGVKWKVSYEEGAGLHQGDVLNGLLGTDGLYEKLHALPVLADDDTVEPADFTQRLVKLNETALVIRNMMMLEENAHFMSRFQLLKDFLTIALNLPQQDRLTEFRQYALDTTEQVTKHWELNSSSAIHQSLARLLCSPDRGQVCSASRAIARIGLDSHHPNRLTDIPVSTISILMSYLLLECDEDLLFAALDIIYQFTAVAENMDMLYSEHDALLRAMVPRLTGLLLHGGTAHEQRIRAKAEQKLPPVVGVPVAPDELYKELVKLPEPERSSKWLKCCFEEAEHEDITQIAIWQAYQSRFNNNNPIPAAEFIKNVSSTFKAAQAQVINGQPPRFIIKGIRAKRVIMDLNSEPYVQCLWQDSQSCGSWHRNQETLWMHLVENHFHIPRKENGKYSMSSIGRYQCSWLGCSKYADSIEETNAFLAAMHVRLHVRTAPAGKPGDVIREAEYLRHVFYSTPVDTKSLPTGVPYMAVLVLTNIARYASRKSQGSRVDGETMVDNLFCDSKAQLWKTFSVHKTLRVPLEYLLSILQQSAVKRRSTHQGRRSVGQAEQPDI